MPVLIIDNYDSFTYNLAHAVAAIAGCAPIVVRNDEMSWDQIEQLDFDRVIISPGPGRPENARDFGVSARAIAAAAQSKFPLLGVCLGHQGIAHHFGGCVTRASEPVHGRGATIVHQGDELFAGIPERFSAIRYHSLIVREPLPPELKKIAWTEDGAMMALRHATLPIWGVQFHPESISTEYGAELLRNFLHYGRRTIQVHARAIPLPASPQTIFRNLFSRERYAFWLDSSLPSPRSRFSYMGAASEAIRYRVGEPEKLFDRLERELRGVSVQAPPLPFDFLGGYVGYFGYELKADCGSPNRHRSEFPDAYLLRVDRFLAIDHIENTIWIVALDEPDNETEKCLESLTPAPDVSFGASGPFELAIERDPYLRLIAECQARIAAGESYEICLTNHLRGNTDLAPLHYYEALRALNPAPHSAFLHLDDISVASSSPERFLRVDAAGNVESRPIKGTSRRGETPEEDAALRAALAASEKNRAENLMIVDLTRNDLARVCVPGSVHVPQMMQVETYATVHQLVSTIAGRLAPGLNAVDCLRAAFPGGSMTGAPKLRTLEILDELEPRARGIYSGSIGYLGLNGALDLNIVIRTAVLHRGVASIGAGGAIVYQSRAEDEWDEMLLKTQAPLRAFPAKLS